MLSLAEHFFEPLVNFFSVCLRIAPPIESPDVAEIPAEGTEHAFAQYVSVTGGGCTGVRGAVQYDTGEHVAGLLGVCDCDINAIAGHTQVGAAIPARP